MFDKGGVVFTSPLFTWCSLPSLLGTNCNRVNTFTFFSDNIANTSCLHKNLIIKLICARICSNTVVCAFTTPTSTSEPSQGTLRTLQPRTMSNRHPPFEFENHGRSHLDPFSMDYINRVLDRYSRTPRRPPQNSFSASPPPPPPVHPTQIPQQAEPDTHRPHKRKHRRHKMTAFNGPWSQDLDALRKAVQSMPDQYRSSFASASKDTLSKVCSPDVLHVYESDSDIDHLLHLTSVIAKLCNLGTRKTPGANASDGGVVIIAEEKSGRSNFSRICSLVEYLTGADGKRHLDGAVMAFSSVVIVRGWNNAVRTEKGGKDAEKAFKRINTVLERVFSMGNFSEKKIVWHHGPVLHFLLHWINTTTSPLRNALTAITITGSLELTSGIAPSGPGRANTLQDLKCLGTYAAKLDIPVLFLDPSSLGLTHQYLNTYMYYYAYYIRTFLPPGLLRPHLHAAQDALVTFAFRLLGASAEKYGEKVVRQVKSSLDPSAKTWARTCVDGKTFEKKNCRNAGKEAEIHTMVQLADTPLLRFNQHLTPSLPGFAKLGVGPAAAGSQASYTAAPVSIDFAKSRIKPAYPTPFYIAMPSADHDATEKLTNHVQGLMMAVLERVRQEHPTVPQFSTEEKEMWKQVRQAVGYAFKKAETGMPKKIEERVQYVQEKMERGSWGFFVGDDANGAKERGGVSEAAKANWEAERVYGKGLGGAAQQYMPGFGGAVGVGVAPPPNSPGMDQQMPQMGMGVAAQQGMYPPAPPAPQFGQGYAAPAMGYGQQQHGDLAYAQSQGVGVSAAQYGRGGGGYPAAQSMGGSWM
jgi:hypothetical protein